MPYDQIIKNGHVVLDSEIKKVDIGIQNGVITSMSDQLTDSHNILDAEGHYIFPGMIDTHVHFNEPGREVWEGFKTGSELLAAGGCTTFFDMPLNGIPSTVTREALFDKAAIGESKSIIDFGLWGGLVPGHLDDLEKLAEGGVIGFKAFLSPSGNVEFEAADDFTLLSGMKKIAKLDRILALHAESGPLVTFLAQEKANKGLTSCDDYLESRPIQAEVEAVSRAINYAEITGCTLHFVHISSPEAVQIIQSAKQKGLDVTLETCPHYLLFNHEDLKRLGPIAKCAPPLRLPETQKALIEELINGNIDMITSDHSPSPWSDKDKDNIFEAWGGINGGQFSLLSMIELALNHRVPLQNVAKWTAKAPAERYGLSPKKGSIQIGADADFAIVSLKESHTITKQDLFAKHKYSLFENHTFPCKIKTTIHRGQVVYSDGRMINDKVRGQWLKHDVYQPN
ncbi:allantoinase [Terrilactibacillus sp. BCM23-1]|uniref:Allantoinase n=1 Tax=Terrilactibacillus tamarindi TaxID=2599694 RepID=A0A6N8CLK8_9BACI|nr:allantoinase [Terrilactibacillus tamarindi]MTT30844.1 allantoinase [Terrilactibacillus tamarindi]